MEIYKKLEDKTKDQTWTSKHSEEDVKFFNDVRDMSENLVSQIYIFIEYFHQYVDAVQESAVFSPTKVGEVPEDGKVYPTQTSSDPSAEEVVVP
jgi:hypothetical protein